LAKIVFILPKGIVDIKVSQLNRFPLFYQIFHTTSLINQRKEKHYTQIVKFKL